MPFLADLLQLPVLKNESTCTVLLLLRGEDGRLTQNEILENKGGLPSSLPGMESVDRCRPGFLKKSGEMLGSTISRLVSKKCRYLEISLVDVDGDHDLDVIFTSSTALHVYEHAEDHTLTLRNATQKQGAQGIQVNEIRLSGVEEGKYGGYHPYLVDWDLDGDLDLALLSYNPFFTPHVIPRFFEHNADHSVSELHGTPNISCPLNWHQPFSVTDFDGDGLLDIVGMRGRVGDGADTFVLVCLQTSSGYVARSQARFFLLAEDDDPKCFSMFHPFFKAFIDTTWIYNLPPGRPLQHRRARILSHGGTILVFGHICQHFWIGMQMETWI